MKLPDHPNLVKAKDVKILYLAQEPSATAKGLAAILGPTPPTESKPAGTLQTLSGMLGISVGMHIACCLVGLCTCAQPELLQNATCNGQEQ